MSDLRPGPEELEPEDVELQRRLDGAFNRTGPSRGFEDALWATLEARPRPSRRGRLPLPRLPQAAWPAVGAAAAMLVVAIVVLPLVLQARHSGTSSSAPAVTSAATGGAAAPGRAAAPEATSAAGWFGLLPTPTLSAGGATSTTDAAAMPYYGPAALTVATSLPVVPLRLPVFRFALPSAHQAATVAKASGGRAMVGTSQPYREPRVEIDASQAPRGGTPPSDAQSLAAAESFLAARKLARWPHLPEVGSSGALALVRYARQFQVEGYGPAVQVDQHGAHAGADVSIRPDGKVMQATVPMALPLQSFGYAARALDQAARDAVNAPPPSPTTIPPAQVQLTQASLVYIAVAAGAFGYFEPAFLLTGGFNAGGRQFEKRVLVSALDASLLSP
jgi:hypothetical protein